jgi:GTP cyclohydrolase I
MLVKENVLIKDATGGTILECLPDIQCTEPTIKRPINQVGVEGVVVPFLLQLKSGGFRQMTARVSMRTDLGSDTKGISMSRLLRTLKKYIEVPLKQVLIKEILKNLIEEVGSLKAFMRFDFDLPIQRPSIKSDYEFPIYHPARFEGQLEMLERGETHIISDWRFFQGVVVQYASYCPCSAELSADLRSKGSAGFPHAQRSFAHILIQGDGRTYLWLEDIVKCVELAIKTLPYPIIKREDEQEIARIAAENPIFVEDAIRAISEKLDNLDGVYDWIIKCIHEESIHTSEAIAINYKGIHKGFDHRYFL